MPPISCQHMPFSLTINIYMHMSHCYVIVQSQATDWSDSCWLIEMYTALTLLCQCHPLKKGLWPKKGAPLASRFRSTKFLTALQFRESCRTGQNLKCLSEEKQMEDLCWTTYSCSFELFYAWRKSWSQFSMADFWDWNHALCVEYFITCVSYFCGPFIPHSCQKHYVRSWTVQCTEWTLKYCQFQWPMTTITTTKSGNHCLLSCIEI